MYLCAMPPATRPRGLAATFLVVGLFGALMLRGEGALCDDAIVSSSDADAMVAFALGAAAAWWASASPSAPLASLASEAPEPKGPPSQ